MDVLLQPSEENAEKVLSALADFGFASLGLRISDILSGDVIQLGFPPIRIDLLTRITGVSIEEIWRTKVTGQLGGMTVHFIAKDAYIQNKKSIGRPKDIADLKDLGQK